MLRNMTIRSTLAASVCALSFSAHAAAVQPADSAENSMPMDEIVVTAQKRVERLQDVPISIAVVSGASLDKSSISNAADALRTVAGVSVMEAYQGSGSLVTVRGVAAGGPLFGGASPVSYYVDAVPFGLIKSAIAPNAQAFDLQQVEVLRGPQGTLYGSNAQNGVVRILTHDADLDGFDFKARVSGSRTTDGGDNFQGDAAVNIPIVEGVLAVRAVVGYEDNSGWIDTPSRRDANDSKIKNARLKINAQPTDNLSVALSTWISRSDYGMPSFGNSDDFNTVGDPQPVTTDFDAYGLKIGYDFPTFSVTSASSYLRYRNTGHLNLAPLGVFVSGVPIDLLTDQGARVATQELNLASTTKGNWRWTAGGMYRRDSEDLLQANLPTTGKTVTKQVSKSYAVYGELTRLFFDRKLELTAGVRYFVDRQTNTAVSNGGIIDRDTFKATTPRFVATFHPDRRNTIYASYSQGFRSGVVQGPPLPDSLKFTKPDKLNNYEVGAKGTVMDGVLGYDAAVYYIKWNGVQQLVTVPVNSSGVTIPRAAIINSQSASGMGADLSLSVRPITDLTLSAQFSWNDLTFDKDVVAANGILFPKDGRLNFSPKYTAGASAEYNFPVGGKGWEAKVQIAGNYTSPQTYRGYVRNIVVAEDGDKMFTVRASVSLVSADKWGFTIFADNLTDERGTPVRTPYLPATDDWDFRIRPRTIGARLTYGL